MASLTTFQAKPVVYLSLVPFRSIRQRPQQVAMCLAERYPILYVEPTRSSLGALRHRILGMGNPVEQLELRGLQVFDGGLVLPLSGYFPPINTLNYCLQIRKLRKWLQARDGWPPAALVCTFPKHFDALPYFAGVPTLYDVMDDYPLFFDAWQGGILTKMHEKLMAAVDVVVASSRTLVEKSRPFAKKAILISNGVSHHLVENCPGACPAPDLAKLPRPRMGYVGAISHWFDFEVINHLAQQCPHGSIILVGPSDGPRPALPANVHLVGPRTHDQLPGVLSAFDLGLIPFRRSEKIDAVNPVKVYEYFAAGLPVASSEFTEILAFGDLVNICRTRDDWTKAIELAQIGLPEREKQRRQEMARRNLWSEKALEFSRVLGLPANGGQIAA